MGAPDWNEEIYGITQDKAVEWKNLGPAGTLIDNHTQWDCVVAWLCIVVLLSAFWGGAYHLCLK